MKRATDLMVVLVTAPDKNTARKLGQTALRQKLIACVNLVPAIESHYWWRGKIENSTETLLLLKTTRKHLPTLEKLLVRLHPYETPEIVALAANQASGRYLKWVRDSTLSSGTSRRAMPVG